MRTARPGPGNGWRKTISLRQAQFQAEQAHFVLEQAFQRLDQLKLHVLGQAADVVMALDHRRRIAGDGHGFDHVGIERALREKLRLARRAWSRASKTSMNVLPMILRLRSGIGHALEPAQEQFRGVLVLQLDLEMSAENLLHHFRLARRAARRC